MNIPSKLKLDPEFLDEKGLPGRDIAIYKDFIVCHPDHAQEIIELIKQLLKIDLEII